MHIHGTWKAVLQACLRNDGWTERLPWVLLSLSMAPKVNLRPFSAQQVYKQALRGPGVFCLRLVACGPPVSFALLDSTKMFSLVPMSENIFPQFHIPSCLWGVGYMFMQHDAHHGPLQAAYDGWVIPYGQAWREVLCCRFWR